MKYYKGDHGFIQPLTVLKSNGEPEDLTDKAVQLLLIDMKGVGADKTIDCTVTDPASGEIEFQPADETVFDVATDYKIRAKITEAGGSSYQRHTEPGYITIEDPNA